MPPSHAIPTFTRPRGSRCWLSYRVGAAETPGCPWAAGKTGGAQDGAPVQSSVGGPGRAWEDRSWRGWWASTRFQGASDPRPSQAQVLCGGCRRVGTLHTSPQEQPSPVRVAQVCPSPGAARASESPAMHRTGRQPPLLRRPSRAEESFPGRPHRRGRPDWKGRVAVVERVSSRTDLRRRGQASQMMGRRVSPCVLPLSPNR